MFTTSRRKVLEALGFGSASSIAGCVSTPAHPTPSDTSNVGSPEAPADVSTDVDRVAADPTDVPPPIDRSEPKHHDVTLEVEEVTAEIEPGVTFSYMTFDGTVPGPMIRVRQGDTISFTMENLPENEMGHNVDMHAIYGTGGGAEATMAAPGESNGESFKAMYPGAYIYHCAVPNMDYHISSGMFGMILVEPKEGLPPVDNEYYFGQHEVYGQTSEDAVEFDFAAMEREDPAYVLLNGEKYAYASGRYGPLEANVDETARVYMVNGGPNLPSYFHPIGNVWSKAWPNGALASQPDEYVQTMTVAPGSCFVGEMEFPVPSRIKLVDHALSRVARKGLLAEIDVHGEKRPDLFDPEPGDGADEGPIYGEE